MIIIFRPYNSHFISLIYNIVSIYDHNKNLAFWFISSLCLIVVGICNVAKINFFIALLINCSLIRRRHVVVCQYLTFENSMTMLNIYVKHTVWFLRPTFCSPSAAMVTCLYMNELHVLSSGRKNVINQSINHSIIQLIFQARS